MNIEIKTDGKVSDDFDKNFNIIKNEKNSTEYKVEAIFISDSIESNTFEF